MPHSTVPKLHHAGQFEGFGVKPHSHIGHELVWVTQGSCAVDIACEVLEGDAGTLFVLPACVLHNQRTEALVRTSYVVFETPDGAFDYSPRKLKLCVDSPARRWLDDLCNLCLKPAPMSQAISGGLLLALLKYVESFESSQGNAAAMHPALQSAVQWLERRLDAPLKVLELVEYTHFSSSRLSELFHREFGCGPHAYHQKLRLEQAANLLQNPYLSIADVGRRCGYEDPNYFARQFRQTHGISPATLRRKKSHVERG